MRPMRGDNSTPDPVQLLARAAQSVRGLYEQTRAKDWGLTAGQFAAALARSAEKRFREDTSCSAERFEEYLNTLHVEDLALASACMQGSESAWETFVEEYRGYLRASAGAITKNSRAGTDARELADSLFAELFGLRDGKRDEHSLFRYFHGRSSLKTWLRTLLAQRHIDRLRQSKRWVELEGEDGNGERKDGARGRENATAPVQDPHKEKYVKSFVIALDLCVNGLRALDRQRLELYYARQMTLAEIGKKLDEHESSVSRNLERVRGELRTAVEGHLREAFKFSEAECALCLQYAAEDAPIDFRKLFPQRNADPEDEGRKGTS